MKLTPPTAPFKETRNEKSPTRIAVEQVITDHSKRGGINVTRIADVLGIDSSTVRKTVNKLRTSGYVLNIGTNANPMYILSADKPPSKAQPIKYVSKDTYDGAELRPYEGRPGAMTAYSLPSLKNGVRVPYNGIRPMLVGALKDNSNNAR